MVEIAIISGILSYLIFGLGLLGQMDSIRYLVPLAIASFFIFRLAIIFKNKQFEKFFTLIKKEINNKKNYLLFVLLLSAMIVNLIGVFGPELSFDSLWYHLTIPKIYLSFGKIFYIPGSLFSYSAMPKLGEMLYLFSLQISSGGIFAKLIHFSFGVFSIFALFKLSRKYLSFRDSLITCLIFYTSLIVGWESITAYVDLIRTFFEILALSMFVEWWKEKKNIYVYESAVLLGLAVSTKLIAFASLPVFLILILIKSKKIFLCLKYFFITLLVVSPWLIFSYINTGNPVYPVFSGILDINHILVIPNPLMLVRDFWTLFYHPQDLISPVFLVFLPIIIFKILREKINGEVKILGGYILLSGLFWFLTPRTGGSRFILPYLPAWSLFLVIIISNTKKLEKLLFFLIILVAVFNIGYRALANYKFVPVLLGVISKDEFLLRKLNFKFNDFYDPGGEIKKIIKEDTVLVFGSHNLFYADFPFFHESFAPKEKRYAYILTQNTNYPKNFGELKLIYQNSKTNVNLYIFGEEYK